MSETIKKQIEQQINDVSYDFDKIVNDLRLTTEERDTLINYWCYLTEIAKELNDKQ